jgi:nicotinamide-nucleotide amidase
MPTAEIITIGTELLLGEIQDTNTRFLARALRDCGVDIYRTMTVGDNINRIAQAIQEALSRTNIIITTGGLGPTVDDPTRQAVAQAFDVPLEFLPHLWDQILARFQRYGRTPGENNKRQAFIPQGAIPIENPVGTAPAFIYEKGDCVVISLPGVPREMEYLSQHVVLPYLKKHFELRGIIKASVLHTASIGESLVDELVGDLEITSNPTVGLLAHPGQVDIRVTAKAATIEEADQMIAGVSDLIRQRLGEHIFGVDEQKLEDVTLQKVNDHGWTMAVIEAGLGGELVHRLSKSAPSTINGEIISTPLNSAELMNHTADLANRYQADILLGASLVSVDEKQVLETHLITPSEKWEFTHSYGGPPQHGPQWAANLTIDLLRRHI